MDVNPYRSPNSQVTLSNVPQGRSLRTLGWVFLGGCTLDAVVSLIASYVPGLLTASNVISSAMFVFTTVAFVLAVLGKLSPRRIFFYLCGYYALLFCFGIILTVLLFAQLRPSQLKSIEMTPQFLRQQFPWYDPVALTLFIGWLLVAAYGLITYARDNTAANTGSATTPPAVP